MKIPGLKSVAVILVLSLVLAACGGSFGPPPECTEGLGGTADDVLFARYFNTMELVSQETGLPGAPAEHGTAFNATETLAIKVDSLAEVSVRACVQSLSGRSIALDETHDLVAGENEMILGAFPEPGLYVVRMILDGMLVKNLTFTIQ